MNYNPHIGRLLRDAFALFERDLLDGLERAGATDLRPTHNAVLRFLDEEGTRASVLADRSGLTRQALTQIVDDLERLGYVARRETRPTAGRSSSSTRSVVGPPSSRVAGSSPASRTNTRTVSARENTTRSACRWES